MWLLGQFLLRRSCQYNIPYQILKCGSRCPDQSGGGCILSTSMQIPGQPGQHMNGTTVLSPPRICRVFSTEQAAVLSKSQNGSASGSQNLIGIARAS